MDRTACAIKLPLGLFWLGVLWLGGDLEPASAAVPVVESLFPAGGQIGTMVEVKVTGKLGNAPVKYWVAGEGLTIQPGSSNNQFSIRIDSNALAGPRLIRAWNAEGASKPRIFNVGFLPEYSETEPNNALGDAVKVQGGPVTYNGRLDKGGDVDSFALNLTAGATLVAALDAYVLGSPLDPHLHLYDPEGRLVAFNHDYRTLDPQLAYPVVRSGVHTVQVAGFAHPPQADVRFAGSAASVYRLTLTTGPFADFLFPVAVQRGAATRLQVHGFNLDSSADAVEVETTVPAAAADVFSVRCPGGANQLVVPVSDDVTKLEKEPNDTGPQWVVPPLVINGRIDPAGDLDRFAFHAHPGEKFEFALDANRLGLPLDGILRLEDARGAELARDDDGAGERDARMTWTAKTDSTNVVQVRDLFGRGGARFVYGLRIGPPIPTFSASVSQDSFQLEPGKSAELKVTIKLANEHTNALTLRALGLPDGVMLSSNDVPVKGGEMKLSLTATTNATPTNLTFSILVAETAGSKPVTRFALFNLQPEEPRGDYLINAASNLWLTVSAKGP